MPRAREFLDGGARAPQPLGCFSGAPAAPGPAGLPLRPWQLGRGWGARWDEVGSTGGRGSVGCSLPLPSPSPQNKSRFSTRTIPSGQEEDEDLPLGEESPQTLLELLRDPHSPWALPPGCSPQDQQLRDMAVQVPQLVSGTRILQVFRSLRIVGKDVSAGWQAGTGWCPQSCPPPGHKYTSAEGENILGKVSPTQGLPRCCYCSRDRAAGSPTRCVTLIRATRTSHGSTPHLCVTLTHMTRGGSRSRWPNTALRR